MRGQFFSINNLQDEMRTLNFNSTIQKIEVPIYFCIGRYDLTVPFQPAYEFYNKLESPEKQWVWFENSAHSPLIEEKDKFHSLLIEETNKDLQ